MREVDVTQKRIAIREEMKNGFIGEMGKRAYAHIGVDIAPTGELQQGQI